MASQFLRFQNSDCSREFVGGFGLLNPKAMAPFCVHPTYEVWRHNMRDATGKTAPVFHVEVA